VAESKFAIDEMVKRAKSHDYHYCSKDMAKGYAVGLVRLFPNKFDVGDMKVFTTGIAAIFTNYPHKWVKELCDPTHGIAVKTEKTLVSLKDVKDALEEKRAHAVKVQTAAAACIDEHRRRAQEAEAEKLNQITPEQRAAGIKRWQDAKREIDAARTRMDLKELEDRIAVEERFDNRVSLSASLGFPLTEYEIKRRAERKARSQEKVAYLKNRLAMLERDPQTVLSSDDLLTPARPPSEELKKLAQQPLHKEGERWV
jgi:hypothetical protein